jgi:hypothetical protein
VLLIASAVMLVFVESSRRESEHQRRGLARREAFFSLAESLESKLRMPRRVNALSRADELGAEVEFRDSARLGRTLAKQLAAFPELNYVAFGDDHGCTMTFVRRDQGYELEVSDLEDRSYRFYTATADGRRGALRETGGLYDGRRRPWYRAAVSIGEGWCAPYFWFGTNDFCVEYVRAVKGAEGRLLGVYDMGFLLDPLSNRLARLPARHGRAFIADLELRVVACGSGELRKAEGDKPGRLAAVESRDPLTRRAALWLKGREAEMPGFIAGIDAEHLEARDPEGLFELSVKRLEPGTRWLLVTRVPRS